MLIQDDFGLQPLDNGSRMHLMDIIKDRYGKKSTLITSQLPVKDRYDVIGKKTIAGVVHTQNLREEMNDYIGSK